MSEPAYCIGVDFGTESGRALLLDARTGEERAVSVVPYPSAVIDATLPDTGEELDADWALQDPDDWMHVLEEGLPDVLRRAGVDAAAVRGLGVDFTSCTVLPVDAEGEPLCRDERYRGRPHAWPKLWKHHAAQAVADRLTEVAGEREEAFLARYGGRISSEWYFPKVIDVWNEDREIYDAASAFVEATDWIIWQLTGELRRCSCAAGYKAFWSDEEGLPSTEYFKAAYPGFDDPSAKLGTEFHPLGTNAGTVTADAAERFGLGTEVSVAVGNVDSFVSVPGAGVAEPGVIVMAVGTSICQMVVDEEEVRLPGITGVTRDGIVPGRFGYEAGQTAVGDMLAWFVRLLGDDADYDELEAEAEKYAPGETGLVVLDWFNGNRSILGDADLSGAILGLSLRTRRSEIYRAMLESIAFGNRRIVDNFAEHGVEVKRIVACGGIADKSPLTMQLLADVSGRPVHVPDAGEVAGRGAALFGAVAAGVYDDIGAAIGATRPDDARVYEPDAEAGKAYDRVYAIYSSLYDLLGRTEVGLMHDLKRIRGGKDDA
ncbi:MAG: ribulokinase [Solirubrobacterales bacterium]|nr:ribulokinase [Solirubrobacterales bacterium]